MKRNPMIEENKEVVFLTNAEANQSVADINTDREFLSNLFTRMEDLCEDVGCQQRYMVRDCYGKIKGYECEPIYDGDGDWDDDIDAEGGNPIYSMDFDWVDNCEPCIVYWDQGLLEIRYVKYEAHL